MSLFHSTLLHDSDSTTKRKVPVQQLKSELSGLRALINRRVLAAPISYSCTPFANSISTITVWRKESACVDLSLRLDLVGVRLCAWRDVPSSMLSAHYLLINDSTSSWAPDLLSGGLLARKWQNLLRSSLSLRSPVYSSRSMRTRFNNKLRSFCSGVLLLAG